LIRSLADPRVGSQWRDGRACRLKARVGERWCEQLGSRAPASARIFKDDCVEKVAMSPLEAKALTREFDDGQVKRCAASIFPSKKANLLR
jgi:hypothetical protein